MCLSGGGRRMDGVESPLLSLFFLLVPICMRLCLFTLLVQAMPWPWQNIGLQKQWRSRLRILFLWRSGLLTWLEQETALPSKPSLVRNWRHMKMSDRLCLERPKCCWFVFFYYLFVGFVFVVCVGGFCCFLLFFPRAQPTHSFLRYVSTVQQCQVHFCSWVQCTFSFGAILLSIGWNTKRLVSTQWGMQEIPLL